MQEIGQGNKVQPAIAFWVPANPKDEIMLINLLAEMAQFFLSDHISENEDGRALAISLSRNKHERHSTVASGRPNA